jgi:L-threonylcarbamoyladenylate synthase
VSNIVPATPAAIARAADILRGGGLVAFPTETVYGLGANALNPDAVRKIFTAKERPGWDPLIVHVSGVAMARTLSRALPPAFETLAEKFWPGPLTFVVEKTAQVPDEVTAHRPTVALRMPRHPLASALLAAAQVPIAAPSANRFGRPSPTLAAHVADDLGARVDLILDAGPTELGVESTVLDLTQSPPAMLRPGGVSREELTAILGEVPLHDGVADEVAAQGLAGPGMTLKHYAPRAALELFESETALRAREAELRRQSRRVGALCEENAERLARELFAELRRHDADGVEVILVLLPSPEGIGFAVRDRLRRAAFKATP